MQNEKNCKQCEEIAVNKSLTSKDKTEEERKKKQKNRKYVEMGAQQKVQTHAKDLQIRPSDSAIDSPHIILHQHFQGCDVSRDCLKPVELQRSNRQ